MSPNAHMNCPFLPVGGIDAFDQHLHTDRQELRALVDLAPIGGGSGPDPWLPAHGNRQ